MRLSSKRAGFFLMECAVVIFLVGLAAWLAAPLLGTWREEKILDAAAAEVCAAIREAQEEAQNGKDVSGNASDWLEIYFETDKKSGRVHYYGKRSVKNMKPSGYLPEGVVLSQNAGFRFYRQGFTVESKTQSFTVALRSKKGKTKGRNIIVAMYTGRVHVEKL